MLILARLLHVLSGILWVGFAVFIPVYLAPAVDDAGPEGGKVMAGLQRRGIMTVLPLLALVAILSGVWLLWRVSAGWSHQWLHSAPGLTLSLGGVVAVAAYLLGILVTRPSMMRAGQLLQSLTPDTTPPDRARVLAQAGQLRQRGAVAGRIGAALLLLSAAAMAVARYL